MTNEQPKKYTTAFIVVTSLFFMWGFITVLVDSFVPRLKEVFELNNFQAGLVQFAFFMAYGLVSIPAGYLLARIGYKKGMVLGLMTMALGCFLFYPAAAIRVYPLFMAGMFVLASGMTILQVAANPYVAILGPERTAASRLNLAQAFNSLGTAIAPILAAMFILSDKILSSEQIAKLSDTEREAYYVGEAAAVQQPFILIASSLVILALIVAFYKLPKLIAGEHGGGYFKALKFRHLKLGAIGIFVYVGAEVAIGSYLVGYFMSMNMAEQILNNTAMMSVLDLVTGLFGKNASTMDAKGVVGAFVFFYWTGAMIGRFIGSGLTTMFRPAKVLLFFAVGAISLLLISQSTTGFVSMWTIIGVGLFNSIMFPTIFTLAIDGLGDFKAEGSGILCTAIVGGAFIPPLYGFLADSFNFKVAILLLILCYGYIGYYALIGKQEPLSAKDV